MVWCCVCVCSERTKGGDVRVVKGWCEGERVMLRDGVRGRG